MNSMNLTVGNLKRGSNFPFQVQAVFNFSNFCDVTSPPMPRRNDFEISIRTGSEAEICRDIINGEEQAVPYPNVAYKQPSSIFRIDNEKPRDSFAFVYSSETLPELRKIGIIPDVSCRCFIMTAELKHLITEFHHLAVNLYSPGVPDLLDWACFRILGELKFTSAHAPAAPESRAVEIRNISAWLRMHYAEDLFIDDIATAHGLSHAQFFREWKKVFGVSPLQYILNARLEAAAWYLTTSMLPVSKIIKEVNFSGATKFYRRFYQKYGMTPEEYRKHSRENSI